MAEENKLINGNLSIADAKEGVKRKFSKEAILEALPCDVLVIGVDGRVVLANSKYCERRGCPSQSLLGADVRAVEPDTQKSLMAILEIGRAHV